MTNAKSYHSGFIKGAAIALLLLGYSSISAQEQPTDLLLQYIEKQLDRPLITDFEANKALPLIDQDQTSMWYVTEVPEVFCYESLGFFCKLEHKAMQRGNFPLRFRLGEFRQTLEAEEHHSPY